MTHKFHFQYKLKRNKNTNSKRYMCIPIFVAVLFTTVKIWKQQQMNGKEDVACRYLHINVYVYIMEYYSTIKRVKFCYL